jgi:hypothetical protein
MRVRNTAVLSPFSIVINDSRNADNGALVSGYRSRDPLNRLTQHELGGLQDFSI